MVRVFLILAVIVIAVLFYTALINGMLRRCPHCRKIGAWRFAAIGPPVELLDDEGAVISATQLKKCRGCDGDVEHVWSDRTGLEIRKVDE